MDDSTMQMEPTSAHIAIIGMAGRFPGAENIDQFWQNLCDGVESIHFFTDEELVKSGIDDATLHEANYVKAAGILEQIDCFDAAFFGYAPREAALMDPQHRLFLECSWHALEDAGYAPETYTGRIGVFAGASMNTYLLSNIAPIQDLLDNRQLYTTMLASEKDFLATRVSYKCNLTGPAITIQTACSTSLVATHMACQSLLNGEIDMALVGGVSVRVPHHAGYLYQESGILSPDGHCRAFDARARGTVSGSGMGVVILKRLDDAIAERDHIYAAIIGSAVNNDGALKAGYTTPSEEGQARVIAEALAVADVSPESISYVEAHGTGTTLGDPIEIAALSQVFRPHARKGTTCAIGSVKTNIGHLDVASGIVGLIKTALALKNRKLPPSLHFQQPNPNIDFGQSPFHVNTQLTEWPDQGMPRRAGVSSFGIGGTNAHVILEEAKTPDSTPATVPCHILPLSAKTPQALERVTHRLAQHLRVHTEQQLTDVAYTLQVGRTTFPYRRFVVCQDREDAITALQDMSPERVFSAYTHPQPAGQGMIFLFPGQGSQYVHMARDLYQTIPFFREQIDICARDLRAVADIDLLSLLYPEQSSAEEASRLLQQTAMSQPALWIIEYALAQLWMSWGIVPSAMIGHSVGEYVAACLSGVISRTDAIALVAARGRIMQEQAPGAMLSIPLAEEEVLPFLNTRLSLAAVNSPHHCVVSGPEEDIEQLEQTLSVKDVLSRRLHTSHAFHSQMMEPALEPFLRQVQSIVLRPPQCPFISNITGTWIKDEEATDPEYWMKHLRATVRFAQGVEQLLQQYPRVLLEVGPGRTLSTFCKQHPLCTEDMIVATSLRHPQNKKDDVVFVYETVGKLWLAGVSPRWERFHEAGEPGRVPLPIYPFERQRYWIEPTNRRQVTSQETQASTFIGEDATLSTPPVTQQDYVAPRTETEKVLAKIWQQQLGLNAIGIHDNFFDLGGDSFQAVQLIQHIQEAFHVEVLLHHMIEAPTITRFSELLETLARQKEQGIHVEHSPLVALKAEGKTQPFFCIHPAGGTVLCYRDLARFLSADVPLYGLQSLGLYGGHEHTTIEETAASHIDAIRQYQPHGPYMLGGMSYGGNVAFEMARQLSSRQEEVQFLAFFDSHPPVSYHSPAPTATEFLAAFPWIWTLYMGLKQPPPVTYEELKAVAEDQQLEYILQRIAEAGLFALDMDVPQLRQFFHVWEIHHHALRSYDPPAKSCSVPITLFRAEEEQPAGLLDLLKINLTGDIGVSGWEALATTPVQTYTTPGNHYTMLNDPNVQELAKMLNVCMKEVTHHEMGKEKIR